MIDTRPISIIKTIETQLKNITTASNFHTDAGQNVHLLREEMDEEMDVFPALCVMYQTESISSAEYDHEEQLTVSITGFIRIVSLAEVMEQLERIDRDIKNANKITQLGDNAGIAQPIESLRLPPSGSQQIGRVVVRYAIRFIDVYGE